MKTKGIKKALLKELNLSALSKVNEFAYVSIQMRSPVLNFAPGGGYWYPVHNVPVDEVAAKVDEGYTFVFRDVKPSTAPAQDQKHLRSDV